MTGYVCVYCKLQTSTTDEESLILISSHTCLKGHSIVIDDNIVYLEKDVNKEEQCSIPEVQYASDESIQQNDDKSNVEWSNNSVLLLIQKYEENKIVLEKKNTMKKHIWSKIANEMQQYGHSFSWDQVQNKWKSLIRTYKSIKNHNTTTGRNKKTWTFFERIEELMAKNPTIEPPYVVHNGTMVNSTSKTSAPEVVLEGSSNEMSSTCSTPEVEISKGKKRKNSEPLKDMLSQLMQQNDKHHEEEIREKRRFNDLLEVLINKLN